MALADDPKKFRKPKSKRRDDVIKVRINETEKKRLTRRALKLDISLSRWLVDAGSERADREEAEEAVERASAKAAEVAAAVSVARAALKASKLAAKAAIPLIEAEPEEGEQTKEGPAPLQGPGPDRHRERGGTDERRST